MRKSITVFFLLLIATKEFVVAFVKPWGGSHHSLVNMRLLDAVQHEPVRTPKTDIPENFGPSSLRDQTLFTCQRPGNDLEEDPIPASAVAESVAFLKSKGIQHVLVLLDDNELEVYEEPGLLELYKQGGLVPHLTPMGVSGAHANIMQILEDIDAKQEKAVTHCTGGTGRAGRVAAAWLASRYDLSPEEATKETIDAALESGVQRLGDVSKLAEWMEK
jgi:hypothetical protein